MNPYLSGNCAPVADEITVTDLHVTGTLPPELEGRWLRNGPNPAGEVDPATHHWFVGDGMVHGVRIRGGRAEWYRNRWVRSPDVEAAIGLPAAPGPRCGERQDGPNTSVGGFAGSTWAMVEAGQTPARLSYELDTEAFDDFGGTLPLGFTAHPKYDPQTRELHAVCYAYPDMFDRVQYVVVGPDARVSKVVDVPLDGMPMIHDMSLTRDYAVVYDLPVTVDMDVALQGQFPFRWNPDHGSRVGLLPRAADSADDIVWCDGPIAAMFHPLNAYDEDGTVVIDLCPYDSIFANDVAGPFGDGQPRLERWTVDPASRKVSVQRVDDRVHEFPIINGRFGAERHRFGYTTAIDWLSAALFGSTYKTDFDTGQVVERSWGDGVGAAEPLFIGRENSSAEDDGWLMVLVYDANRDTSDLVLLDAQDVAGPEVARVALPRRVPHGFHGAWVSDRSVLPPN